MYLEKKIFYSNIKDKINRSLISILKLIFIENHEKLIKNISH